MSAAVAAFSVSSTFAEGAEGAKSAKGGAHFLLGINGGGSYWKFSGKDNRDQELSAGFMLPSTNLFLGLSYYFNNGFTLGLESQVSLMNFTPRVQLGYMLTTHDQISLGLGYNLLGRAFVGLLSETTNEKNDRIKDLYKDHKELENLTDLEQSALSGASAALNYRHFFQSNAFFQAEVKLDYYNLKAKEGKKGDASLFDTTFNVGFGKEW